MEKRTPHILEDRPKWAREPVGEHLDVLLQGLVAWNAWRNANPLLAPRLSWCDLSGCDLSSARLWNVTFSNSLLTSARLSGSHLFQAEFYRADLREADLSFADLRGAKLHDANLEGASLRGADLFRVDFIGTQLAGVDFTGAKCHLTAFSNVDLRESVGLEEVIHKGPSSIDAATMRLNGNSIPVSFYRGAGLSDAMIQLLPRIADQSALRFYSCFISYSHEDKRFARRLHDALQGQGIRCWLDDHNMLPGDDIYDQVDQAIRLWDKVLLCASRSSLTSWWVNTEIEKAFTKERKLMKERERKTLALVPLDLDGYLFSDEWKSGKATEVRSRLAADFTGWESNPEKFERQVDRVVRTLWADDKRKEDPPPSEL